MLRRNPWRDVLLGGLAITIGVVALVAATLWIAREVENEIAGWFPGGVRSLFVGSVCRPGDVRSGEVELPQACGQATYAPVYCPCVCEVGAVDEVPAYIRCNVDTPTPTPHCPTCGPVPTATRQKPAPSATPSPTVQQTPTEFPPSQTPTSVGPTATPTHVPSETPRPEPTATHPAPPTKKPACNRGLGNGSEDCDPGNSGGKPGSAGEDNE